MGEEMKETEDVQTERGEEKNNDRGEQSGEQPAPQVVAVESPQNAEDEFGPLMSGTPAGVLTRQLYDVKGMVRPMRNLEQAVIKNVDYLNELALGPVHDGDYEKIFRNYVIYSGIVAAVGTVLFGCYICLTSPVDDSEFERMMEEDRMRRMKPKKMKSAKINLKEFKMTKPLRIMRTLEGEIKHALDTEKSAEIVEIAFDPSQNEITNIGSTVDTFDEALDGKAKKRRRRTSGEKILQSLIRLSGEKLSSTTSKTSSVMQDIKLHKTQATVIFAVCAWQCHAVLPTIGSNYTCEDSLMRKSLTIPTSVNSVRPADIKLVMALGDSLTAGGDGSVETHITIPNILKKYNPQLFGQSYGIGSPNVWEISYLNVAVPGAIAADLAGQARTLSFNFKEDWKLLNIFIGGNDMCSFCHDQKLQPAECVQHIEEAIQVIFDNVPRVIVSITAMLQLEVLRQSDQGRPFCEGLHRYVRRDECPCESDSKDFNNTYLANACIDYANREMNLAASGKYDKADFAVVTQPFFRDVTDVPTKWGHALVSTWLWKNILEPVGAKTTRGSALVPTLPLACPDPDCPFIRTNMNSKDCTPYLTPVAKN
ncbi:unnamed protein product [Heligmosomoides polygyrus]|uniref:Phospholipase B1, membrane-associated n=1 Tax=Heligmosomoides polygyrus TaxID=6339 RepID=A0A3P7WLS1_HELPZ|nr:unnamed protein product [Heligmosomoides polygyrus]